jgi:phage/plasmid-associated DNA primase
VHLVLFNVTIPDSEKDPKFIEKLKPEMDGILLWLVEGCRAWMEGDSSRPTPSWPRPRSTALKRIRFRDSSTSGASWAVYAAPATKLYSAYKAYSEAVG